MTVFVGKEAIDFTATAVMPDNSFCQLNLKNYLKGHKGVLFAYPLAFTFVCPTEIIAFHNSLGEFTARNTKIVGLSVDSHFTTLAWKNTQVNKGGIGQVQYPIVSDLSRQICQNYNILNDDSVALRGTFIIDEDFIIRHMLVNDLPLGRNIKEAIRILDAIDYSKTNKGEACPVNWKKGESGLTQTAQGVADFLTSNAETL